MPNKARKWLIAGFVLLGLFVMMWLALPIFVVPIFIGGSRATLFVGNHTTWGQMEAVKTILEVGKLAKIPTQAKITSTKTEGSMFTRAFRMKFQGDPSVIKKWISDSKGLQTAEVTHENGITKYVIKNPGMGYCYAEVIVNANFSDVNARVMWS